ncbi:MAG TPA: hypothetical protein VHN36_02815 [Ilumatobacteraceae bacterium]|nr:hypothetical protein [Ilumatobacteraceae bacterium]
MPYHLEKGHYLLLLEATLNEGIEAVVDDDTEVSFPGLARRYSMLEYMRGVVARPCSLSDGESEDDGVLMWPEFMSDDDVGFPIFEIIAEDWFGYRIRNNGTFNTSPHPNKPTGMWDGYQGNVERIVANVMVRCLEVSLGLDHDAPIPEDAPPRSWPLYFFFKCQQPFFEGWVTWQCHSVNRRAAGQVTVIFATPGHNHPVSDHPIPIDTNHDHRDDQVHTLRNDGEFLVDPVSSPAADVGGQPHQGVWVVTHRDHKKLNVFDTSVPSAYLEWGPPLLPIIAPENFCDVVTVQPAARSGGVDAIKPGYVAP